MWVVPADSGEPCLGFRKVSISYFIKQTELSPTKQILNLYDIGLNINNYKFSALWRFSNFQLRVQFI